MDDLFRKSGGNVAEYAAGRDHAIAAGTIQMHECGSMFMWTVTQALPGTENAGEA
jgi:hypothetical protein